MPSTPGQVEVLRLQEGTLYPALHRLEQAGLVEGYWQRRDDGVDRRYYRLTAEGLAALPERRAAVADDLRAHLRDAAVDSGRSPIDADLQAEVIRALGSPRRLGRALAQAHHDEQGSGRPAGCGGPGLPWPPWAGPSACWRAW